MDRKNFIKEVSVLGGTLALGNTAAFNDLPHKKELSFHQSSQQESKLNKAYRGTLRLAPYPELRENVYDKILGLLDKYIGVADEIAFFTDNYASGIPMSIFKERIKIVKNRMIKARKRGFKAGINMYVTLGHTTRDIKYSLHGSYVHMTGIDGRISPGCYCPNHDEYQSYLFEKYKTAAETNPAFIWVDDDARMSNHSPLKFTCFCDKCLEIFKEETGEEYTRSSLKKILNEGSIEKKLKYRSRWLQHNRNTMDRLMALIEQAIHGVDSTIIIGKMTGDRFYDGYDFDNYAKLLSGKNKTNVMWRPGGGFYTDKDMNSFTSKSHAVGRQSSILPDSVFSIQSEIECVPCQQLDKAARIVALEAATYIAAGCTGTTYSILPYYYAPLEQYEPLLAEIDRVRPFFNLMVKILGRSKITGVQTFWNKNTFITNNLNRDWLSSELGIPSSEIYEIGLPACYSNKHAEVTLLRKNNVFSLAKEDIKLLLSKSVYIDAETLQHLNTLGFDELTGFKLLWSNEGDITSFERYLKHPLNGKYAGFERRGYPPTQKSWSLKKTNDKAETLTNLYNFPRHDKGIGMGIFENKLGGRICVAGYKPFNMMGNAAKSWQMKSVFKWLTRNNIAGYVASFHKINLWIREPQNDNVAGAFIHPSYNVAKDVVLMLKTSKTKLKLYGIDCRETIISSSGQEEGYQKFIIPNIGPWEIRLVEVA